ncbi:MAG: hypothetical protein WD204_05465 [Acidimicrobiia bacterium]
MSDDLPVAVHLAKGHHEPKSFPDLFAHMMCDHGEVGPHEYDDLKIPKNATRDNTTYERAESPERLIGTPIHSP